MKAIPFAEYRDLDAVNFSSLKEMRRSPLHYFHRLTNARPDTTRFALGRAAHTAVLEPDKFLLEYVMFKGAVRRGKKWDEFKAVHEGTTILKRDEYERCLAIRDAVRRHRAAMRYLERGTPEPTLTWTDPGTGLKCKGRPDWISDSALALVDFKTTSTVDADRFASLAARMGYHQQLAFYLEGLRTAGVVLPAVMIVAEAEPPHDVAVFRIDEDAIYAGAEQNAELLAKVAQCRSTGRWPGQYEQEETLRLPSWAWPDEGDEDATGLDLIVNGHSTGG